jgi:hypothetical protein
MTFVLFGAGQTSYHQLRSDDAISSTNDVMALCGDIPALEGFPYVHNNPLDFNDSIKEVIAASHHTLIHTEKGRAFGMGWNDYGQTGAGIWYEDPTKNQIYKSNNLENCVSEFQEAIIHGHTIHRVYSRQNFTVFVTEDMHAWACGWNNCSCLGLDDTADAVKAITKITGNDFASKRVIDVGCGGCYMILVTDEYKMYGTGKPIGINSMSFANKVPTEWDPLRNILYANEKIVRVVCNSAHCTVMSDEGRAWHFGKQNMFEINFQGRIKEIAEMPRGCMLLDHYGNGYTYLDEKCLKISQEKGKGQDPSLFRRVLSRSKEKRIKQIYGGAHSYAYVTGLSTRSCLNYCY